MKDWKKTLVTSGAKILEVMRIIDESSMQIALVIDEQDRLVGVISDGDIRRGLLRGIAVEKPVELIMNKNFTSTDIYTSREETLKLMKQKELRQIPVLDEFGHILNIRLLNDLIEIEDRENLVVLMAGGLGLRLKPLTDDCPKPLLKIGDKPILETIISNFINYGFNKFIISVNYKAEMIKEYFKDGSQWKVDISYLHEDQAMGTVGALGLLDNCTDLPLVIMNADLLTNVNFQYLLDFHLAQKVKATMCVRDYLFQVPYGVVKTDHSKITRIDEKPIQRFLVNAGIYVLDPELLELIPKGKYLDMTTLFESIIDKGYETAAFPIREYWKDIGYREDYERANGDYIKVFK